MLKKTQGTNQYANIHCALKDRHGNLWFGIDKGGNIWFSGGEAGDGYSGAGGIYRYDGKNFTNYRSKDGLGNYSVWSMIQDNDGNLWVGTRNTGLYKYDGKTFVKFSE